MYGNLLNNDQIARLVEERKIQVWPDFDLDELQVAQYPIYPAALFTPSTHRLLKLIFKFEGAKSTFEVKANDYLIVEALQRILLPEGIVGRFIVASNLIEQGFLLTAGKIEHPYGEGPERIRFGLKNALERNTFLSGGDRIAYIEFFDLRGLANRTQKATIRDQRLYRKRFPPDRDGHVYHDDEG